MAEYETENLALGEKGDSIARRISAMEDKHGYYYSKGHLYTAHRHTHSLDYADSGQLLVKTLVLA